HFGHGYRTCLRTRFHARLGASDFARLSRSQPMTPEMQDLITSATHARPELLLALFALVFVVVGAWFGEKSFGIVSGLGVLALAGAGLLAIYDQPGAPVAIFRGELSVDGFAIFAKVLIAFSAAVNLALGADNFSRSNEKRFEFPVLIVLSALGMFVMVS